MDTARHEVLSAAAVPSETTDQPSSRLGREEGSSTRRRQARIVAVVLLVAAGIEGPALVTQTGQAGRGATAVVKRQVNAVEERAGSDARRLGSLNDQLHRLPDLAPGALVGVLVLAPDTCHRRFIDLRTLAARAIGAAPCVACQIRPSRCVVFGRSHPSAGPTVLPPLAHEAVPVLTLAVPRRWFVRDVAWHGVVLCPIDAGGPALLRGRGVSTKRLRSCPVAETSTGRLLFLRHGRRTITDEAGRSLALLPSPVAPGAPIDAFGDGLVVVGHVLFRGHRRLWRLEDPTASIIAAAANAGLVLLGDGTATHLTLVRGQARHRIDAAIATRGGAIAPDGRHLLLQHDPHLLIEFDASLRPIARLVLSRAADLLDWQPRGMPPRRITASARHVQAMAEGTRPVTAGSEGAAEHAVLTEHATLAKHALVRSLIRNVGREGAAEHAGLR